MLAASRKVDAFSYAARGALGSRSQFRAHHKFNGSLCLSTGIEGKVYLKDGSSIRGF